MQCMNDIQNKTAILLNEIMKAVQHFKTVREKEIVRQQYNGKTQVKTLE